MRNFLQNSDTVARRPSILPTMLAGSSAVSAARKEDDLPPAKAGGAGDDLPPAKNNAGAAAKAKIEEAWNVIQAASSQLGYSKADFESALDTIRAGKAKNSGGLVGWLVKRVTKSDIDAAEHTSASESPAPAAAEWVAMPVTVITTRKDAQRQAVISSDAIQQIKTAIPSFTYRDGVDELGNSLCASFENIVGYAPITSERGFFSLIVISGYVCKKSGNLSLSYHCVTCKRFKHPRSEKMCYSYQGAKHSDFTFETAEQALHCATNILPFLFECMSK